MWQHGDDERNRECAFPDDERVSVNCLWVAEFFTPSHVEGLLSSFRSLGWDDDSLSGHNPVQWVQRGRATSYGKGWLNLGVVTRPGENLLSGLRKTAPLPTFADYAFSELHCMTSSITCVLMGYVVNEQEAGRYERALRQPRETFGQRMRTGGYRILEPRQQKEQDIREARNTFRTAASGWFKTYMPGLFSEGMLAGEFPTCEVVTLRKATPFPGKSDHSLRPPWYLQTMEFHLSHNAWRSKDYPGVTFAWPIFREEGERFHAAIAANEKEINNERLKSFGGENRRGYANYLSEGMGGLMSHWALFAVLSAFERHLNIIRDSATLRPRHEAKPLAVLQELGLHVGTSVDIAAVAADLRDYATAKGLVGSAIGAYSQAESSPEGVLNRDLAPTLCDSILGRATRLESAERSVRDLVIQQGSILSARENIKLQGRITFLTWVLVVLTVLLLWRSL